MLLLGRRAGHPRGRRTNALIHMSMRLFPQSTITLRNQTHTAAGDSRCHCSILPIGAANSSIDTYGAVASFMWHAWGSLRAVLERFTA